MRYPEFVEVVTHELIGSKITVLQSTQPELVGMKGTIVNETKNMLDIKTGEKVVRLQKKTLTVEITFQDGVKTVVDGNKLLNRPEERLKKHWRKIRHGKKMRGQKLSNPRKPQDKRKRA